MGHPGCAPVDCSTPSGRRPIRPGDEVRYRWHREVVPRSQAPLERRPRSSASRMRPSRRSQHDGLRSPSESDASRAHVRSAQAAGRGRQPPAYDQARSPAERTLPRSAGAPVRPGNPLESSRLKWIAARVVAGQIDEHGAARRPAGEAEGEPLAAAPPGGTSGSWPAIRPRSSSNTGPGRSRRLRSRPRRAAARSHGLAEPLEQLLDLGRLTLPLECLDQHLPGFFIH